MMVLIIDTRAEYERLKIKKMVSVNKGGDEPWSSSSFPNTIPCLWMIWVVLVGLGSTFVAVSEEAISVRDHGHFHVTLHEAREVVFSAYVSSLIFYVPVLAASGELSSLIKQCGKASAPLSHKIQYMGLIIVLALHVFQSIATTMLKQMLK